jgi:diguanylate cyclase (GGDEF)-like protein/PAS domain S-box-containing protein
MSQRGDFYQSLIDEMSDGVYFVDRTRTITFWSRGAERLTGYEAEAVVGRKCHDGILNHVDDDGRPLCGARCPLKATILDGRPRDTHVWLHHADGHRQPVWVRAAPIRDTGGKITGAVEVFSDDTAISLARSKVAELERMALADPLTGLGNRRYLMAELAGRCRDFVENGWGFGVLFVDIDRFKRVNDEYGHDAGDDGLKMVARTLSYALRGGEVLARYGGEEFVVLVPQADHAMLAATAELLRRLVASSRLVVHRREIPLTVSIGATVVMPGDDPETLLRRADALLYAAKDAGRDQVAIDGPVAGGGDVGPVARAALPRSPRSRER